MKLVLSWLKDFVDLDGLSLEDLARTLTMVGLEVEEVQSVGLPLPVSEKNEFKYTGLAWEPDKFVVAQIDEVMPHPNADRLVLCRLKDGKEDLIVLTGAPNLYPYKGLGLLSKPIKVAYAREGAVLYDGHQPGQVLTKLKRTKIRGVESFSMVCSEKELGISEEHEGIILLDENAPTGMSLVDYMGDAVISVSILPNMNRNSCMLGAARELAAVLGKQLRTPQTTLPMDGPTVKGQVAVQITDPQLNSRFLVGLLRNAQPKESPYWVQRRLRLAGMRPINSIVDATNYIMLETGEPLHAFDYDELLRRAGGKAPTIITRAAYPGEKLMTLDNVERALDTNTILVTDTAGALSLAGVMGGLESEVTENTRNVLLEGASWNFINIRKTMSAQKLASEAAGRFSRGVHPALSEQAVRIGLDRMAQWSGGQIAADLVDNYPKVYQDPTVCITEADVKRHLGIDLAAAEISALLSRLEFTCRVDGKAVYATAPALRLDIGEGVVGLADVMEEVARMYGYDNVPARRMKDSLPEQKGNLGMEREMRLQNVLVDLGFQEIITYRLTSPEREIKVYPPDTNLDLQYIGIANPIASDRVVMRRNLVASMLEVLERNIRLRERLALFEIGPVFLPAPGQVLPEERGKLVISMSGLRTKPTWDIKDAAVLDFYDLKGALEGLLDALHITMVNFKPGEHPSLHPGKCAEVWTGETLLGVFGELHPLVKEQYGFLKAPVLIAELELKALLSVIPLRHESRPVPVFPAVLEDLAVIVDETLPAEKVAETLRTGGGKLLVDVRLFDIFRGPQVGEGKKSLAYSLTYQAPDRTLDDQDSAKIRKRIIAALEKELDAKIRS